MGQKKFISALLRSDAQTTKKITEMYPADWNMDAVFRRSCRKLRHQTSDTEAVPKPAAAEILHNTAASVKRPIYASRWLTTACLMLTIGIAGGTAWMLLTAPKLPETVQISSTADVFFVEKTQPEQNAADSGDAGSQHAHTTAVLPDTGTSVHTQTTGSTPSESASAQTQRTDMPQNAETAAESAQRTTSAPPHAESTAKSTQRTTAVTTHNKTTALPRTETEQPVRTTVTTSPAPPGTEEVTESCGDPEEPPNAGNSAVPSRLQLVDDPEISETEFYIWYEFEDQTMYSSPDFTVDLEGYSVTIIRPNEYTVSNSIVNEETGVHAWAEFHTGMRAQLLRFRSVYSYQKTSVRGQDGFSSAYLLTGARQSELIWFDGRYLCSLRTDTAYADELFRIAEAMITH